MPRAASRFPTAAFLIDMPLYEYCCEDCGAVYERLVRAADEKVRCPACGSERARRKISPVAATKTATKSPASCHVKFG